MVIINKISYLTLCGAVIAITVMGLSIAMVLQIYFQSYPCSLCILQRYLYFGILSMALVSVVCNNMIIPFSSTVLAGISSGVGIYHIYARWWVDEELGCATDKLELFLNQLKTAKWFPELFTVTGLCTEPFPVIAGIDLVILTLISSLMLLLLTSLTLIKSY